MYYMWVAILSLIWRGGTVLCQDPVTCTAASVCYQGSLALTNTGVGYQSYQGIPYAKPPVAALRFKAPEAYQADAGEQVDVSGNFQVVCPQLDSLGPVPIIGEEDCLKLNVYVPEDVEDLLPVMIWIHGGGLETGSNNFVDYGPLRFLDKGMLVVAINYRLGPLGYLSLGTDSVPGNAGLLDQVMALQWVQDNIASFNGDPGKVTVFGESAGSASIAYHILSPRSKGLFQRGILQSGTPLGLTWGGYIPAAKAVEYSDMFLSNLLCTPGDLACIQSKSMVDIINNTYVLDIQGDALGNFGTAWMPVMDADFTEDSFLPGNPQDLLNSGEFNSDVEIIIGSNRDEGLLWMLGEMFYSSQYEAMAAGWDMYGPMRIFNIADPDDITAEDVEKARAILKFYTGGSFNQGHLTNLVELFTDSFALYGVFQTMEAFVAQNMKVFHYILTYEGEYSLLNLYGLPTMGVCHADDVIYLFDPLFGSSGWDSEANALTGTDLQVSEYMVSAWANFAAFGDPTPPSAESSWLPVGPGDFQYLNISGPAPQMDNSEDVRTRMEFWTNIMK